MREVHRVLKPGGKFVVCDSAQTSGSSALSTVLDGFHAAYHEPFYKNCINDPLEAALKESGFTSGPVRPCFVSKVIAAEKQGAA